MKTYHANIRKIVDVLINNSGYNTLDFISNEVNISKRSVQNYLDKINALFEAKLTETKLVKKQGLGIKLETNEKEMKLIDKMLQPGNVRTLDYADRLVEIIRHLIFSDTELTIQYLADQLYESRSTILSDLDWVNGWLGEYDLHLLKTQSRGISIVGTEINKRNAMIGFFDLYKTKSIKQAETKGLKRIDKKELEKLAELYPMSQIEMVYSIIEDAEKEFDFFLIENYFTSMLVHIIISITRLKFGSFISKDFLPLDDDLEAMAMETARFITKKLGKCFHITVQESETKFVALHLMGFNAYDNGKSEFNKDIEMLSATMIQTVDMYLGTNFFNDKVLFFDICWHMKFCKHRNILTRNNNLVMEISAQTEEFYKILKAYKDTFTFATAEKLTNIDLMDISYYFYLSVRRNKRKLRVLIVSNLPITERLLFLNFMELNFSNLEIVDLCTTASYELVASKYDFIISTENISSEKPLANLSLSDKEKYKEYIDEFVFLNF
jgi:transcriptional antiterminator